MHRSKQKRNNPDLGALTARLLFAVQRQLAGSHAQTKPATEPSWPTTELAELFGQHKQVIGTLVDELEALGLVTANPTPPTAAPNSSYPPPKAWPR